MKINGNLVRQMHLMIIVFASRRQVESFKELKQKISIKNQIRKDTNKDLDWKNLIILKCDLKTKIDH